MGRLLHTNDLHAYCPSPRLLYSFVCSIQLSGVTHERPSRVSAKVHTLEGDWEGSLLGCRVGSAVGTLEGNRDGIMVGRFEGRCEGFTVGRCGASERGSGLRLATGRRVTVQFET
jgi:hypothetical protein